MILWSQINHAIESSPAMHNNDAYDDDDDDGDDDNAFIKKKCLGC